MKKWGHGRGQSDTVMYSVDPGKVKKDARSKQWPKKGKGRNNNNQYNLIWSISYVSYMKRQIRSHSTSLKKKINSFCSPPHSYISRESASLLAPLSPSYDQQSGGSCMYCSPYVGPRTQVPLEVGGTPLLSFKSTSLLLVSCPKGAPCLGLWFGSQLQTPGCSLMRKGVGVWSDPPFPHRNCPPLLLPTHTPAPPQTGLLPTFSF